MYKNDTAEDIINLKYLTMLCYAPNEGILPPPFQLLRPDQVEPLPISLNLNDFGLAGLGNLISIDRMQCLHSVSLKTFSRFSVALCWII